MSFNMVLEQIRSCMYKLGICHESLASWKQHIDLMEIVDGITLHFMAVIIIDKVKIW